MVRIRNWPDAGHTTVYHKEFTVPPLQHVGVLGSPVPVAHELSPLRFTPKVREVALHGKSLVVPDGSGAEIVRSEYGL